MTIFLILAFAALAVAAASPSRQIPLDPREPNKDTYLVDHTFPGFAFEGHSWELFAGTTRREDFALLRLVKSR